MRHNAVQVSIDGVPLGIALSQIAGVHREKGLLLRPGEPRLGPDRSGDCVDLADRLGGLGVWTRPRREVFQRQLQCLGHRCEHTQRRLMHAALDLAEVRVRYVRNSGQFSKNNRESSRWARI
jgi:hypothetical protein